MSALDKKQLYENMCELEKVLITLKMPGKIVDWYEFDRLKRELREELNERTR